MPPSARSLRTRLSVEQLETRLTPSSLQPNPVEQQFLERLNDACANPAAYGASIGLDLSGVRPSQPLAFNTQLIAAARGHSQDMAVRGYFAHNTPEGITPEQRMRAAGFKGVSFAESIDFAEMPTFTFTFPSIPGVVFPPTPPATRQMWTPENALEDLIVDFGVPSLGHRKHLLAIDPGFRNHAQVGIGYAFQDLRSPNGASFTAHYYTVDTAATKKHEMFLTGCVFRDLNGNGLCDAGEGLAGVKIRVAGAGTVQDFDSGGYTVPLRHGGNYRVTASGGGLGAPITKTVHVGRQNVRLNFIVP
jgi:hypothetical protein